MKSGQRNYKEETQPMIEAEAGDTDLHRAARAGDVSEINRILNTLGSENEVLKAMRQGNSNGGTPLHGAAGHGGAAAVQALLAKVPGHEAELTAIRNNNGVTPVQAAARNGQTDALDALFENVETTIKQQRLSEHTNRGLNALHLAARNGHTEMAQRLVSTHGANKDATCRRGNGMRGSMGFTETAAELARRKGHIATANALEPTRSWAERIGLTSSSRQAGASR